MSGFATDITITAFLLLLPYLFVMLRVYKGLTLATPFTGRSKSLMSVSVVIATHNPPDKMAKLIEDLEAQEYPTGLFEIIIADDSRGMWDKYVKPKADHSPTVSIISNRGRGKKEALQSAVEVAVGDVIITTDDDCRVGQRWLLTIISYMQHVNAGMIICPIIFKESNALLSRFQQLEFAALQGVTAGSALLGDPLMCNGAGIAFRKELYPRTLTVINPNLLSGDDTFLIHHLKKRGSIISWLESEEAIVETEPSQNLIQFWRQRSRWASKALHYTDLSTILTGMAVLTASVAAGTLLIAALFDPTYLPSALALLLLKSVPDMLIITNRIRFYKKARVINLFPVAQIIYPFYAVLSFIAGLFRKYKW